MPSDWWKPLDGKMPFALSVDFESGDGALVCLGCLRCNERDEKWLDGPVTGAEVRVAMLRLAAAHSCEGWNEGGGA